MFEPILNAGEVELPDHGKMQEQFLTLVMRGSKITHERAGHDDFSNAVAGLVWLARGQAQGPCGLITPEILQRVAMMPRYRRPIGPDERAAQGERLWGERRFAQLMMARQRRW